MKTNYLALLLFLACINLHALAQFSIPNQRTAGGKNYDFLNAINRTLDGGIIAAVRSNSNTGAEKTEPCRDDVDSVNTYNYYGGDYWIVKYDSLGNKQWDKTLGGTQVDACTYVEQTKDSGYILGGWSVSPTTGDKTELSRGGYDYWIIKLDKNRIIQWQRTIGGASSDYLTMVIQTKDGGYLIGGSSSSDISGEKTENSRGDYDYWIVKLNNAGAIQWQKTFGGSGDDELTALQQTKDGGYILGGFSSSRISGDKTVDNKGGNTNPDMWVLKLNSTGGIVWQKTYGGSENDYLKSLQQTTDGGYIYGGSSNSPKGFDKSQSYIGRLHMGDYWVVKADKNGVKKWDKTFGGSGEDAIYSQGSLRQTSDSGYIVGGSSISGISGANRS